MKKYVPYKFHLPAPISNWVKMLKRTENEKEKKENLRTKRKKFLSRRFFIQFEAINNEIQFIWFLSAFNDFPSHLVT